MRLHFSIDEVPADAETAGAAVRAEALRVMREEDPFDYIFAVNIKKST